MQNNNQYEPAPGKVTEYRHFNDGVCWTHGNFVARRKRSGCFSFPPAPRKLFFFEVKYSSGSTEMNQLLKPTVSWVSLFGGLNVVAADSMPFAGHALVAFIFDILALGRCLHVDMQMYKEFVKCVINGPVCSIHLFLSLAIMICTTPTEHCHHRALRMGIL
ncbi:hypothetical protein EJB05_09028, partial [Eragrostis curvula]